MTKHIMKLRARTNKPLAFCILVAGLTALTGLRAAEAEGWTPLFDGQTLEGWTNPYDWGEAWVEEGEIRLRADKKFFLVYDKVLSDFVFEAEIKMPEGDSNSGFMFRAHQAPNRVFGYQAEVDPSDRQWSGGLYDEGRRAWLHPAPNDSAAAAAFVEATKGAFQRSAWNHYRIECRGDRLQIWVNGVQTTDYRDAMDAEGYLAIQHHGESGKVYRFRNLRVKELKPAPFSLRQETGSVLDTMGLPAPEGATVLLDASGDLTAWEMEGQAGSKAVWPVEDGVITVVPNAGSLVTKQDFRDFALHLEFNVPERGDGNSGIYIQRRYEVQIMNTAGKRRVGNSDSGAIYQQKAPDGENAALPGGQWQTYDIVFRGARWDEAGKKLENARISVRLNGRLVHHDYAITNKTGAGLEEGPSDGPIKLQDHGARVQFRNIWVQPL
ncbi:MAG: DUF1080 domain-containing protein [Verrucomicrobiota bacterium]|jgi:hypothetical protein|nr:DUF1080 domain-containing protein [Verrucomicrobiota bacterium]